MTGWRVPLLAGGLGHACSSEACETRCWQGSWRLDALRAADDEIALAIELGLRRFRVAREIKVRWWRGRHRDLLRSR